MFLGMPRAFPVFAGAINQSTGPYIILSNATVQDDAAIGDVVGTASISGTVTGTPSYSLSDDDGGKYAIDSSTGDVTVADTLTAGTDSITVSVSGVTPAVSDRTFSIAVSHVDVGFTPSLDFSDARNSMYIPLGA